MRNSRHAAIGAIQANATQDVIGELIEAYAICSRCESLAVGLKITSELTRIDPCPDECGGSLSWVGNRRRLI